MEIHFIGEIQQTSKGKIVNDIFSDNGKYYEEDQRSWGLEKETVPEALLSDIHMAHYITSQWGLSFQPNTYLPII